MESLDVKDLVIYAEDESDGPTVTGVREFFVAKALLEGHKEQLSELVPSQWGLIHIFDLCLWFGHDDTALALGRHGVDGCFVLTNHLGPYSEKPQCTCSDFVCANCDYYDTPCNCSPNETCEYCSWGWPVENGTWMKDWDVPLDCAVRAAAQAAQKPFLCELLKMARAGKELPLALPAEGMARLLDIAILTGDVEVAAHISKKCQVWPLRRWNGKDFVNYDYDDGEGEHILLAALWAGADFQSMHVLIQSQTIPLQAGIFLCRNEDWEYCAQFFKPAVRGEWGPTSTNNDLGGFFFDGRQLSVDRIQGAPKAGIDIRKLRTINFFGGSRQIVSFRIVSFSLLGLAILYGQQDCAVACVRLGLQQTGVEEDGHVNSSLRDFLHSEASCDHPLQAYCHQRLPSGPECGSATVAAAQAALRASWQSEAAQKGVAVCQVMRKMLGSFPLALVGDILTFSTEVPEFVGQLDLWNFVHGWMTLPPPNSDSHMKEELHGINESNGPRAREHETGTGSASDATAAISAPEPMEVDGKSTDELMTALRASRDQVPALNVDGVCVFRLTRMATSSHINDLLLDATGPLATLHARVLDAGCEVNPEWNPVKALFVPVTEEQMEELRALANQGYELNKDDHILALQEDQDVIAAALKKHLRCKNRPKIKKVGPQSTVAEEDLEVDELGTLLEVVCGIRTDSDVGMPSYPNSPEW